MEARARGGNSKDYSFYINSDISRYQKNSISSLKSDLQTTVNNKEKKSSDISDIKKVTSEVLVKKTKYSYASLSLLILLNCVAYYCFLYKLLINQNIRILLIIYIIQTKQNIMRPGALLGMVDGMRDILLFIIIDYYYLFIIIHNVHTRLI